MARPTCQAPNRPARTGDVAQADPPSGGDCYLRMGFTTIDRNPIGYRLHCLACSWSEDAPECAIAIHLARAHARQNPVGSAGHLLAPEVTPAQLAAARNYVRRIPMDAQQSYAEEYLLWALAGKPPGSAPLLRCFGLSLAAGEHLAATIERLLELPPSRIGRRHRR